MLELFDQLTNESWDSLNDNNLSTQIKGLTYLPNYISNAQHDFLWESIYQEVWLGDLKRRVQHYGYKYDYRSRYVDYTMKIGDLPNWALLVGKQMKKDGHIPQLPDQLIVNEYQPGQGIANHIDCEPCFADTIISLSLGSNCIMDFIHKKTKEKIEVFLEPKSMVILSSEARYLWTHGIRGRKTDTFKRKRYKRTTRVSLTFRNVLIDG